MEAQFTHGIIECFIPEFIFKLGEVELIILFNFNPQTVYDKNIWLKELTKSRYEFDLTNTLTNEEENFIDLVMYQFLCHINELDVNALEIICDKDERLSYDLSTYDEYFISNKYYRKIKTFINSLVKSEHFILVKITSNEHPYYEQTERYDEHLADIIISKITEKLDYSSENIEDDIAAYEREIDTLLKTYFRL